jgi:hypothetical protein
MTKSNKKQQKKKRHFEAATALVWGRAPARRRPAASSVWSLRLHSVLLLLAGALIVGALWLAIDERFYVYHADVVGAVRVSHDEIFQASGLAGLHILWARPAEIEKRILDALPTVESAQVKCSLPAKCAIVIVERQPRMMWDENGLLWWVDVDGVIFHAQGALSGGWTIRGPLPRDEEGRLDEHVRVALAELWATGEDVASEFEYVPERGLVFTDERGWRVILGQRPGMAQRLQVLERLTADLEARGVTPQFVDVRFADAPYYSTADDW